MELEGGGAGGWISDGGLPLGAHHPPTMTEPTLDPETTAAVAPETTAAPSFSFCDLQREVDGLRDSLAKPAPAKKGSEVTVNALSQWAFLPPKVMPSTHLC